MLPVYFFLLKPLCPLPLQLVLVLLLSASTSLSPVLAEASLPLTLQLHLALVVSALQSVRILSLKPLCLRRSKFLPLRYGQY